MKKRQIIVINLCILFILIAFLATNNLLIKFDNFFYNLITFRINDFWVNFYKFWTFFGSTSFIICLCGIFIIISLLKKDKYIGFIFTSSIIISTIINNFLKLIIMRPRPNVLKYTIENTFSFPSGHTMAATTAYGIIIYLIIKSNMSKKKKIILSSIVGLIPFLVALSRVYLGAHYVSDVIGAFVMSSIILLLVTDYIDKKKWL